MTTLATISGIQVDQEDPCALYRALYSVKLGIIAGEHVEELSIQSPVTRELIRFSSASMAALDAELMRLAAACCARSGKRSRFAKSMRFERARQCP